MKIQLFNNKSECCSCWACANICPKNAITMRKDSEGFFFPDVDNSNCIGCRMCLDVCPTAARKAEADAELGKPHVRIINYSMDNNCGAVIAGACLEKAVKKHVTDDVIIQTIKYDKYNDCETFVSKTIAFFVTIISFFKSILKRKPFQTQSKQRHYEASANDDERIKNQRYEIFADRFLNFTSKMTNKDLRNDKTNNRALICGSDVIWEPERILTGLACGFYLNFGGRKVRKIAYAPAIDYINSKKLYLRWPFYFFELLKFDRISFREKENLHFIQSATLKKVTHCCDPVFLFEAKDFDEMIDTSAEQSDSDYLYAYILMKNDAAVRHVKEVAAKNSLTIYFYAPEYSPADFGSNSVDCKTDGPAEFLMRIKNASYIVTTSFHCVAFSIIFKKDFLSFTRNSTGNKIRDLLDTVGIHGRLVSDNTIPDKLTAIDYNSVDQKIKSFRKQSEDFLKNSLSDI